ncbi:MAG TPA: isoprenylcysteine carboxylmethyltransferase family protein [Pseudogracilibacillus sp.]|nr:isoprenylcysteine carboxylmethyltransferase family protein [Pseudogracilibacillus sp.]
MTFAYIFIGIVIAERLVELKIAAKNESWMKQHGGFEVGKGHYKLFIIMHVAFFLSLMVELQYITVGFHISLFILFMLVQLCRVWCMLSLGRFWNTKIIVLPSVAVIKTGPYKYMKHPNYVIVFAELFLLPAMFGALWTASLFPLLHMSLLSVRIPLEDKALGRN